MAGRDIHASTDTALQANVVIPVLIGRLDIAVDPIIAWSGPGTFAPVATGDTAMDGQTFSPLAPFITLTNIAEDQGIGGPVTLTLAGHDLDEDALRQVVRDKRAWRGKKAYLWEGLLDTSDEKTVIANPVRIKTGVMVQITTNRDKESASVSVTIDMDIGNAKSAPYRWIDHTRFWSADEWSTFIIKLANKPVGFMINGLGLDRDETIPGFTGIDKF